MLLMLQDMALKLKLVMRRRKPLMPPANTSMITPKVARQFTVYQLDLVL